MFKNKKIVVFCGLLALAWLLLLGGFYLYFQTDPESNRSETEQKEAYYRQQEANNVIPAVLSPTLKEELGVISEGQNIKPMPEGTFWLGEKYKNLYGLAGPGISKDSNIYGVSYLDKDYAREVVSGAGTYKSLPIIVNTINGNPIKIFKRYQFDYDFNDGWKLAPGVQVAYDKGNNTALIMFLKRNKVVVVAARGDKNNLVSVINDLQEYKK